MGLTGDGLSQACGPDPGVDWDEMVLVGTIVRPHGLRGQVVVKPETDFVEARYGIGATFWCRVDGRLEQRRVQAMRVQGGRPVIGVDGCETVEAAERLVGVELRVPQGSLQPLPPGTYYQHQLVGCVVETRDGREVGRVVRVDGGMAGSLLAIDGPRGEVLIPLAERICTAIDVAAGRITIEPPEGLLELNERGGGRGGSRTAQGG